MPQQHVNARQLKEVLGGSTDAHQVLVRACLDVLALRGIPATPISTTGTPVRRRDGSIYLIPNELQEGFWDIVFCLPPSGRLGLADCKTGEARLSARQRDMRDRYAAAGALTIKVGCTGDLINALESAGYSYINRSKKRTSTHRSTHGTRR
ncbi:MAG TPA: hypothetical protein VJY35_08930 [Candidatus Eisenbacteria bacterium]|nr:hypothetical protein [Candidatus Eisenbacteria bacterium]